MCVNRQRLKIMIYENKMQVLFVSILIENSFLLADRIATMHFCCVAHFYFWLISSKNITVKKNGKCQFNIVYVVRKSLVKKLL